MSDSVDIAEVARLTGLTSRALRFYEARGLVKPLRTASGRRHYGPAELERLHHILAMKRAGLTLAQIARLTAGKRLDLRKGKFALPRGVSQLRDHALLASVGALAVVVSYTFSVWAEYRALSEELAGPVHALSVKALAPGEGG